MNHGSLTQITAFLLWVVMDTACYGGDGSIPVYSVDCVNRGTADYGSIGDAIAATSGPGLIKVGPGRCTESELTLRSDTQIIGSGSLTAIVMAGARVFVSQSTENIAIRSLRIVGSADTSSGILLEDVSNAEIEDIVFEGVGKGTGMIVRNSYDIAVRDNVVSGTSSHGIAIRGQTTATTPSRITIENNQIRDAGRSCLSVGGASFVSVDNNSIENCGSRAQRHGGISVTHGARRVRLSGNDVRHAARGIQANGVSFLNVYGNTIEGSLIEGAIFTNVENVTVTGNTVLESQGNGIQLWAETSIRGVALTGNHLLRNRGWGIRVSGSDIPNAVAVGNLLSCNGRGGIGTWAGQSILVEGNNQIDDDC